MEGEEVKGYFSEDAGSKK